MIESSLFIIGLALVYLGIFSGTQKPLLILIGVIAVFLAYKPFFLVNSVILNLLIISFLIWFSVDFRRRSLRIERLPLSIGIILYLLKKEQTIAFIENQVLRVTSSNPYPLYTGIIVLFILWILLARLIRKYRVEGM